MSDDRDWTLYDRPYDEARMDRFLDDPPPEPIRPGDVLTEEELAEYYRDRGRRRG